MLSWTFGDTMVSILEVVFALKEYASQWENINALIFGICVWQRQGGCGWDTKKVFKKIGGREVNG